MIVTISFDVSENSRFSGHYIILLGFDHSKREYRYLNPDRTPGMFHLCSTERTTLYYHFNFIRGTGYA